MFALHRLSVVFLPIAIIPIIHEGLHVAVFSATMFGEVDALTRGVILLHHDVAIAQMPLHISVHQFENEGLPTCYPSGLRDRGAARTSRLTHF